MFCLDEPGKGLKHRHFDKLPLARPRFVLKGSQRGDDGEKSARLVGDDRRQRTKRRIAVIKRRQATAPEAPWMRSSNACLPL
jgi:hypothetical protein